MTDATWRSTAATMCSTPFGITEGALPVRGRRMHDRSGAQRLSASQRWARSLARRCDSRTTRCAQRLSASQRWARIAGSAIRLAIDVCSTPFGITEVGTTARSRCCSRHADVLNAFRHHRGGHAAGPSSPDGVSRCSTPFGITEVGTSPSRRSGRARLAVLNAFRHHRGGHGRTCSWTADRQRVLNAFRHHRGGHAPAVASASPMLCSTPFGITEVGTTRPRCRPRHRCVLNAFRHHRGGHSSVGSGQRSRCVCSTPFGITEVSGSPTGCQ